MPLRKRQLNGEFQCGETVLCWSLLREQQWSTEDGWRGPVVEVARKDGNYRHLLLQYPWKKMVTNLNLPDRQRWTRPDYQYAPSIREAKIKLDTETAMSAGWDCSSRGKPFVYDLEDSSE
jgi:hypothetical protein